MRDPVNNQPSQSTYDVFRYLAADKYDLYLAVMRVFMQAKQRFALHLKPGEVVAQMADAVEQTSQGPDRLEVEQALQQLSEWGNLHQQSDSSEVRTVEDFKRSRFLYQLSAEGEAAERALALYRESIARSGELQTTALEDIEAGLNELALLIMESNRRLDDAKLHSAFQSLFSRFETLATRAQDFIGGVQRAIDLQERDIQAFLAYKERLIEYLERFLQQLVVRIPAIRELLLTFEDVRVDEAFTMLAHRELRDALERGTEARERLTTAWRERWDGLRAWFLDGEQPSQADLLRMCARGAIPELLAVVSGIHEQRARRSDRTADYRELARWFADCGNEGELHQLWRSAFCLCPTRHLTIDAASLERLEDEAVPAGTSWLDAPPMLIAPHLRATGRAKMAGRQAAVTDYSKEKEVLQAQLARQTAQMEAARGLIVTGQRTRLSDFATLDQDAFGLFLDCLGAALSVAANPKRPAFSTSADGSLRVELQPIPGAPLVKLETTDGWFSGPDHWIHISDAFEQEGADDA